MIPSDSVLSKCVASMKLTVPLRIPRRDHGEQPTAHADEEQGHGEAAAVDELVGGHAYHIGWKPDRLRVASG
jgi:hypothetical protein